MRHGAVAWSEKVRPFVLKYSNSDTRRDALEMVHGSRSVIAGIK
jgi:hypothetical protein